MTQISYFNDTVQSNRVSMTVNIFWEYRSNQQPLL